MCNRKVFACSGGDNVMAVRNANSLSTCACNKLSVLHFWSFRLRRNFFKVKTCSCKVKADRTMFVPDVIPNWSLFHSVPPCLVRVWFMPKLIRHMELIINKSLVFVFVLRCVLLHSMRRFKRRMWKPSHVPLSLATTQDVVDCTHTHTNK